MRTLVAIVFGFIAALAAWTSARADHVVVRLDDSYFLMEGKVADRKARILKVTHEKFRAPQLNLYFRNRSELLYIEEVIYVPSRKLQFDKQFAGAEKGDAKQRLDAARWALKHGMLPESYRALELVVQADANHAVAKNMLELRQRLAAPLAESDAEEKQLREMFGNSMKIKKSPHYLLIYDTPDARAQERLDLLERVYETFFMWFALNGRVLDKPPQRLMVALFNDQKDYLDYSTRLDPDLKNAAGFWSGDTNVAVFFAQGTRDEFKRLTEGAKKLEDLKKEAERLKLPNRGDLVRLADTLKLLVLVAQENEDIEVVTHEATHQVAGNSGLFPRRIRIPKWAQEGMAAFFEAPYEATWSGIGAVNQYRLDYYRALRDDRVHSDVDFIVTDQIYSRAASNGAIMHAYGQAWALTHFLMDKRFDDLMKYYANLARLPADMVLNEQTLKQCFDAAFGKDRQNLDRDWRQHMNSLQTDMDKLRKQYGSDSGN
jgi:hypothetical protein